ncbi:MAG: RpoL/Rpb11 RNA polymerase subunit family protein [Candidatus Micrarchaeia archaeon]
MDIKIIKNESNEIWLEFQESDLTIPDLIASTLLENGRVDFAGVRKDHPEIGKPVLVIKAKKNASEELLKSIQELEESIKDLESQLSKKK